MDYQKHMKVNYIYLEFNLNINQSNILVIFIWTLTYDEFYKIKQLNITDKNMILFEPYNQNDIINVSFFKIRLVKNYGIIIHIQMKCYIGLLLH